MRILIIQTAFLGDVILITPMLREIKAQNPNAQIDVLVRKGNENLLQDNPHLHKIWIWDKKKKYRSLFSNVFAIRKQKYDHVVCVQRYFNAGFLAVSSKAKYLSGFRQNPWSFLFHYKVNHQLYGGHHEVDRNFSLLSHLITKPQRRKPELFPNADDHAKVEIYQSNAYYCIAPASVWFTKQLPEDHFVALIKHLGTENIIFLLGSPNDFDLCERIKNAVNQNNINNLSGQLTLLQSAALMKNALRNYVNDSGPLHLASAMNAKVTAFFCSTVPDFGFGPLSDDAQILQTTENLTCRPCGSHGFKTCPKKHFRCGITIDITKAKLD